MSISSGTRYYMVGLPDNAAKESLQWVASAVNISGFCMQKQKIVVNLAHADIKTEGSSYDLPIAILILAASGQISNDEPEQNFIMGELSLNGSIQPIKEPYQLPYRH